MINQDTVEASSEKECVSKMIQHEKDTHPEMPQSQAIAVAYKKCRERFGKTEGDSVILKNQVIASEGVLPYVDGNKLKVWDDLKLQIGSITPIIDEHPLTTNGNDGLVSGNEQIFGYGEIKSCPIGKKTICTDALLADNAPLKKGYSIGFTYNEEKKSGEYNGQHYDSIQHITGINHIALTNEPRNPIAIMTGGDSVPTPGSTSESQKIVKYNIGYDSFKSFKFSKRDQMPNEKEEINLDSLQKEIASLKKNQKEYDDAKTLIKTLEDEKVQLEAARVKAEGDSGAYKKRLEDEITKRVKVEIDSLVAQTKAVESKDFDGKTEDFIQGARFMYEKIAKMPAGSILASKPVAGDSNNNEKVELDSVNNYRYNHATNKMEPMK